MAQKTYKAKAISYLFHTSSSLEGVYSVLIFNTKLSQDAVFIVGK